MMMFLMNSIIYEDVVRIAQMQDWCALNGKRILITGATGMLGAYLAYTIDAIRELQGYDIALYLICRNRRKAEMLFSGIACNLIIQDIRNDIELDDGIDYILHTAGPVGPTLFKTDPLSIISTHVEGTLSIIKFANRCGSRGLAFASTHEVYGATQGEKTEKDVAEAVAISEPRSCYILGKQAAENALACASIQSGLSTMSVRLSRLYGPLMNLQSGLFVCDFINDTLHKIPIRVLGGLHLIRPLCYVSDAAGAMLKVLICGSTGEAYNVQGDELPTIGDIAGICAIYGIDPTYPETGKLPPSGHWLNTDKLKSLGWRQTVPLEYGLKRTINFFEKEVGK